MQTDSEFKAVIIKKQQNMVEKGVGTETDYEKIIKEN
jgi:hypothetical protein